MFDNWNVLCLSYYILFKYCRCHFEPICTTRTAILIHLLGDLKNSSRRITKWMHLCTFTPFLVILLQLRTKSEILTLHINWRSSKGIGRHLHRWMPEPGRRWSLSWSHLSWMGLWRCWCALARLSYWCRGMFWRMLLLEPWWNSPSWADFACLKTQFIIIHLIGMCALSINKN